MAAGVQIILILLMGFLPRAWASENFVLATNQARGHWTSAETIELRQNRSSRLSGQFRYYLYYGEFQIQDGKVKDGHREPLTFVDSNRDWVSLSTAHLRSQIPWLIKQRIALVVLNHLEQVVDITYLQMGELLDELYFYSGNDLGVGFDDSGQPHLKLWAPTAKSVRIHLYDDPNTLQTQSDQTFVLEQGESGVWAIEGDSSWEDKYYLYEVEVFMPESDRVELNFVTDPYSISLASNSIKSQILDVNDERWKPAGWDNLEKPEFKGALSSILYELHVRDFSIRDESQPIDYRGTYMAFTAPESNGMKHLRSLAESGLTHIHLNPINDFVTVEELLPKQLVPSIPFNAPTDSTVQQEAIRFVRSQDGFNWGYDPYHYLAPEGSYSTDPMGGTRIREVRAMVQALNQTGLRLVQDVVFNHTFSGGLSPYSVLDKIVPGYYYRLNQFGQTQGSSCCADTASERLMMEKLMLDSIEHWAKTFKLDGFRFDLMNLHTKQNAREILERVRSFTPETHGVEGDDLLVYGEGWDFGSLKDAGGEEPFTQPHAYGMGIATFNDRMRDALRGGTTSDTEKSDQGFVTGLFYDFNKEPANRNTPFTPEGQRLKLLHLTDVVRVGMAGNLRDYYFRDHRGQTVTGGNLFYRGVAAGYAASPIETISYVSAHDGYTLFDSINAKAPFFTAGRYPSTATMEDRVRMQKLALGTVALSQGIPFFHAGSELLRSKSGDVDSYDSGDWFNYLDYSYKTNNWGVGLPPAWKNEKDWAFWQPRLANPRLKPQSSEIQDMLTYFKALLRVRSSSALFNLESKEEVQERVRFLNAELGPHQLPGLIVMQISDQPGGGLDVKRERIVIAINASSFEHQFQHQELEDAALQHHRHWTEAIEPRLKDAGFDLSTGTLRIPARTILVLEEDR